MGIRGWLVLLLLAVLIPIIFIQALIHYERLQTRRDSELRSNLEVARAIGRAFEAFLQNVLQHELAIGFAAMAPTHLSDRDMGALLVASVRENPTVRSFSWVGPQGRVLVSSNPKVIGFDISDRPYFKEIVSGGEWSVSDLLNVGDGGEPVFGVARGFRDENGNLLAVVLAAILPERLDLVLAMERPNEGSISIVDRQGMLVYRFPHIKTGWEERNWADLYPTVREALKGNEATGIKSNLDKRKSRFVAATPILSIGWAAVAGTREEEAMRPITSSLIRHGGMFVIVTALSVLLALAISRIIAHPVRKMQEQLSSFQNSGSKAALPISGPAEVRDFACAFNSTMEALRSSEERFAKSFENSPNALVISRIQDGRIENVNSAFLRLFGYGRDEVVGKTSLQLGMIHPADRQEMLETLKKTGAVHEREADVRTKTGAIRRAILSVIPIDLSAEAGMLTTVQDISRRKQMEEDLRRSRDELELRVRERTAELERALLALAESENRFREVLENSLDAVYRRNLKTDKYDYMSPAMVSISGYSPEELMGMSTAETLNLIHPDDHPLIAKHMEEYPADEKGQFTLEYRFRHKDGSYRWFSDFIAIVKSPEGAVAYRVGAVRDITERKQAEQELKEYSEKLAMINRELQEFSFVASHDLNEPLRKIQTFGSLLAAKGSGHLSEVEKDYISRMTGAATRMQELLDALLRYSRIETRGQEFGPIVLNHVLQDAAGDLEVAVRNAGAMVEIDPLPTVRGDPDLLRQLFQNLIENALKYVGAGVKPLVKVYARERADKIRIFVEDNGIGFDEKYTEKIFQPFQRLHGRNEYPGTGMGLAICKKIVERHGGTITAGSTLGKGSTFMVELPKSG